MKYSMSILLLLVIYSCTNNSRKEVLDKCCPPKMETSDSITLFGKEENLRSFEGDKAGGKNQLHEIQTILPEGFSIVQKNEGREVLFADLDSDGKKDAIALIEMRGDTTYDQSEKVLIAIFTRDRHGELSYASSTKNLGGEALMYDDNKSLSVKNRVIVYFHQSMRHELTLKFRYDIGAGDFLLIGKDFKSYGSIDEGPSTISINYLTGIKLINESQWDDELEEAVPQPQQKETFKKSMTSISSIDFDSMYDDL